MPAPLKIVGYALDSLVKLSLKASRRVVQLRRYWLVPVRAFRICMVLNKAVHTPEESLNAFDAGILPIKIAIGRGGEEAVKTRGVGAVAGDHFVGADDVAQAFRHFRAVFDHHTLREDALDRFPVV